MNFPKTKWPFMILGSTLLGVLLIMEMIKFPDQVKEWGESKITSVNECKPAPIGIIFGAGLGAKGGPSHALYDRLTIGAQLYKKGCIQKILVSGDNSGEAHNEPEVMEETLKFAFNIPQSAIVKDDKGFRTHDSCFNAKENWGVTNAILISQEFHLPRALYTCEHFGIESTGVSSSLQTYKDEAEWEKRERLAIWKMFIDLYLWSPNKAH